MKKNINVALDGPSGSGKSTIASIIANELGLIHLDTGAIYRTVGYKALISGVEPDDGNRVERLLIDTTIKVGFDDKKQIMLLDGADVTDKIRTPQVSAAASKVAAIPAVRAFLLDLQRDIASNNPVILDGRDIGSCVLPKADVKVYLTASEEVRARRRLKELQEKGIASELTLDEMIAQIAERDYRDSHREIAPLTIAENATVIDSSNMTIEQVCNEIIQLIRGAK